MSRSPHLHVDEKVRALSAMQFSLASAVGEVHRHAGIVATAWGNANMDSEHLRSLLHEELHGLMGTLQDVSTSKSTQNTSGQITSPKMAQSPLSKAANTEAHSETVTAWSRENTHTGWPTSKQSRRIHEVHRTGNQCLKKSKTFGNLCTPWKLKAVEPRPRRKQ